MDDHGAMPALSAPDFSVRAVTVPGVAVTAG
jgi:hypothetical protein